MARDLTIVLDVGKSNSKLTLWEGGRLLDRRIHENRLVHGPDYVGLDAEGIEAWMAEMLRGMAHFGPVGSIVPVSHGAAAALIRENTLAALPLDYEEPITPEARARYDAQRDAFAQTGSPALPLGLNLGAQIDRLEALLPALFDGDTQILPWAQYWAWVLSGVAASEVTSLGCHTDLWLPKEGRPSPMAERRGWARMLAPLHRADDVLGTIRPEWSARTGLSAETKIYCGLHDSNAALSAIRGFPEINGREATVLSTGTWFVAMRSPGQGACPDFADLSEDRDCLVNVDPFGLPIPSARFMGGRAIEVLSGGSLRRAAQQTDEAALRAAIDEAVAKDVMIFPTVVRGVGPFPSGKGGWLNEPQDDCLRTAAIYLYAALVSDVSLDLIGSRERLVVEGRFAKVPLFVSVLANLRNGCDVYTCDMDSDVSYGALRLINPDLKPSSSLVPVQPLDIDLSGYKARWLERVSTPEYLP